MWEPPAGYADLKSDADRAPAPAGPYVAVVVPEVGVVHACLPAPAATSALATSANPKADDSARLDGLNHFVRDHLTPGEYEALLERMVADDLPPDTVRRCSRAIATMGTTRPYPAVLNLALVAAHSWRTLRTRLRDKGIRNAMELPSMHDILDEAEKMAIEAAASDAENANEARSKVTHLFDQLYKPDPKDPGQPVARELFTVEETEESFDAFLKAAAR